MAKAENHAVDCRSWNHGEPVAEGAVEKSSEEDLLHHGRGYAKGDAGKHDHGGAVVGYSGDVALDTWRMHDEHPDRRGQQVGHDGEHDHPRAGTPSRPPKAEISWSQATRSVQRQQRAEKKSVADQ